jgi:hypothetical protein
MVAPLAQPRRDRPDRGGVRRVQRLFLDGQMVEGDQ